MESNTTPHLQTTNGTTCTGKNNARNHMERQKNGKMDPRKDQSRWHSRNHKIAKMELGRPCVPTGRQQMDKTNNRLDSPKLQKKSRTTKNEVAGRTRQIRQILEAKNPRPRRLEENEEGLYPAVDRHRLNMMMMMVSPSSWGYIMSSIVAVFMWISRPFLLFSVSSKQKCEDPWSKSHTINFDR